MRLSTKWLPNFIASVMCMKKSFLLISLISLVFFWLGSVSFAVDCSALKSTLDGLKTQYTSLDQQYNSCKSSQESLCTPVPKHLIEDLDICNMSDNQSCDWEQKALDAAKKPYDACIQNANDTCKKYSNQSSQLKTQYLDIDRTQYGPNCVGGTQNGGTTPTWNGWSQQNTPAPSTSACKIVTSELSGDINATGNILGTACVCNKTFGRYYDTTLKKYKCGPCSSDDVCCGTRLNTKIPFIGDCIESAAQASGSTITETTAFPMLVSSLVKIIISVILIASFILIIAAGVMRATGNAKWGKDMIIKVVIWLALLWASGVILRLINPNFFG